MDKLRAICCAALLLALVLASCAAQELDIASVAVVPAGDAGKAPEDYLAVMTLEQKAGQLILLCAHSVGSAGSAARLGAGGVCLYANAFDGKDRDGVRAMIDNLQSRAAIPLIVSVDEEGGSVCRVSSNPRLRASRFSSPRRLYAEGGWARIESDTREKARLLLDLGINLNLAPVCDVPLSGRDYIYSRSFGTDAALTAQYVELVVRVMGEEGIGATLKHFPGYGGSSDTHSALAVDTRKWAVFQSRDLLPFAAGIAAGADFVMVSHNLVEGIDLLHPASLSEAVHIALRQELGFEGIILTDDLSMGAIEEYARGESVAVQALLAGNDMLCCSDFNEAVAAIVAAVEDGSVPISRVDESVLRVLRWKRAMGLI